MPFLSQPHAFVLCESKTPRSTCTHAYAVTNNAKQHANKHRGSCSCISVCPPPLTYNCSCGQERCRVRVCPTCGLNDKLTHIGKQACHQKTANRTNQPCHKIIFVLCTLCNFSRPHVIPRARKEAHDQFTLARRTVKEHFELQQRRPCMDNIFQEIGIQPTKPEKRLNPIFTSSPAETSELSDTFQWVNHQTKCVFDTSIRCIASL